MSLRSISNAKGCVLNVSYYLTPLLITCFACTVHPMLTVSNSIVLIPSTTPSPLSFIPIPNIIGPLHCSS